MFSVSHARKFVQHVLPAVIRPLRVMWNQIIGFFFLVLAVWAAGGAWRHYKDFDPGSPESLFRLVLSSLFILLMAGFGIYSFWRAHKAAKS